MSHIVIDARESGTSTGRYIDKLVEFLHVLKPNHRFTIITKPGRVEYIRKIAPSFDVVETNVKEFTFAEQFTFKKEIEALQPDLVHFPAVQQPVLYTGKVVTTFQDLTTARFRNPAKNPIVFWIKQRIYIWLNKWVAHKSAGHIAISEWVKNDVADFCKIDKNLITVTLEASDPMEGDEPFHPVDGKKYIMYLGRPTPHKNLGRLIDAFVILKKNYPDLYLVLVGKTDFNYRQHEERVKRDGIPDVIFAGFVPDEQFKSVYSRAAVYCVPSLSEGFCIPGLEAMTYGAPVASSSATCLPEVYGSAAHYFNPYDPTDIARAIDDILTNPKLRKKLIELGYKQVKKYSWKRMAQETLAVYEKTLKKP
jgi:glycosyltransferase involved in cell wall biosynthesis